MPDASLIMLFIYQCAGTVVLWGATFVTTYVTLVYIILRIKELLP